MKTKITIKQQEIIEAAGKILSVSGVSGLTIKNLAKEMQFSEAAIYRHFKSKEDIVLVMLEYLAETLDEIYTASYWEHDIPENKLLQLFTDKLKFFKENPHFAVVTFSDGLFESSQKINEAIHRLMQTKQKHITAIIKENQKSKNFTQTLSEEELIHLIMGVIRLQMFKWRVANFEFDIVDVGIQRLKNIIKLIKKK
ncbi:MAG: TetR/AcrR family fatty acid metabolism transcriptional regulator [Ulvibacter sp.]|jgi:TetR/AcrR family fatty acid metabolism transcriptional regulator